MQHAVFRTGYSGFPRTSSASTSLTVKALSTPFIFNGLNQLASISYGRRVFFKSTRATTRGHHSNYKTVSNRPTSNGPKTKEWRPALCAGRGKSGRAPPSKPTIYSRQRQARSRLHILHRLSPHADTALLGFPATLTSPWKGARSKRTKTRRREREDSRSAGRQSHAAPRAGRHHVVPAAEECREGGTRTHPRRAHAHSAPRARTRLPPPAPRPAPNAEAERPAGRRRGAWRPTVTRPPAGPLPPPPPHAPQVAAGPSPASHFPPTS